MTAPGRTRRARLESLMRGACRLWPRSFRDQLGDDMAVCFAREVERIEAERGRLAAVRYSVATLLATLLQTFAVPDAAELPPAALRGRRWRGPTDALAKDVRHALRLGRRHPGLVAATSLTMGLAIGATSTMFSIVDAVLLRPLPYREPEALVSVWEHNLSANRDRNVVSPANFHAWRDAADSLQDLSAVVGASGSLTGGGEPERVGLVIASASVFPLLGARAELGRVFTPREDAPGSDSEPAVLGYGFWQRRFGGDPGVVGRTLTLNGRELVVVGVLSQEFRFDPAAAFNYTGSGDLWIPHRFDAEEREATGRYLQVVGRLRPGATVEGARAQLQGIAARLAVERPESMTGWSVNVLPLREQLVGEVSTPLLMALGAVVCVLLIACANVASLLLVHAAGRTRELAVRAALGAGRGRVVRQLLTEAVLLAAAGGSLGVALAFAGTRTLLALAPDLPRLQQVGVDGGVLSFACALTLSTGLLFGLAPALRSARVDLASALAEGSGRAGAGRDAQRGRAALVVAEIALSLVLLCGAGLLVRSFWNLAQQEIGFEPDGIVAADVQLPSRSYPDAAERARFFDGLVGRVRALPGVEAASAVTWAPLGGPGTGTSYWPNDRPRPEPGAVPGAGIHWVDDRYFETMGIPLLAGRSFDPLLDDADPLEVVVSRSLADEQWPGESPLGKSLTMPWGEPMVGEVVGVVGDVRVAGPMVAPRPTLYWHQRQFMAFDFMTLVARSPGGAEALAPALRSTLRDLDPSLPLYRLRTLQSDLRKNVAPTRFAMLVLGAFALFALVLAGVGTYGVVAYAFRQRRHEMGVRLALGAERGALVRLVLRSGLGMVGLGVALGIGAAISLGGLMQSLVFGVGVADPLTLLAVSALLSAVALVACYLPARRAVRVDAAVVLREV